MEEFKDKMLGCYNPYHKRMYLANANRYVTVLCPCGKCINCLRNYQKQWQMRMREEMAAARSSFFITLTYSDEFVPNGDDELLLYNRDYQNFLKRLRKRLHRLDKIKLRYVVVGEYGGKSNRPHYHFAIYLDQRVPYTVFKRFVDASWQYGFTSVEYLDIDKIHYLVKYFNKLDEREHSVKSFRNMSNGIGKNFLTPAVIKYYKETKTTICHRYGKTYAMPRYYKDRIFNEIEKETLLLDSVDNWHNWLRVFHDIHGNILPWNHYAQVNEEKINRACIYASHFTDDDRLQK